MYMTQVCYIHVPIPFEFTCLENIPVNNYFICTHAPLNYEQCGALVPLIGSFVKDHLEEDK